VEDGDLIRRDTHKHQLNADLLAFLKSGAELLRDMTEN
jgi:hypothetical protein